MSQDLCNKLDQYVLWNDGDITVNPADVHNFMHVAGKLCTSELTADIRQYNKLASPSQKIRLKQQCDPISNNWVIPDYYLNLDILSKIVSDHNDMCGKYKWSASEALKRKQRIIDEYILFEDNDLLPLLRVLCYIVDQFEDNSIVWGPGRGSSVSSYILYILHVHDVDSVAFELDISDFI
jgi:DNA polymerase III alpha subunit